jgi:hypothetical protein
MGSLHGQVLWLVPTKCYHGGKDKQRETAGLGINQLVCSGLQLPTALRSTLSRVGVSGGDRVGLLSQVGRIES